MTTERTPSADKGHEICLRAEFLVRKDSDFHFTCKGIYRKLCMQQPDLIQKTKAAFTHDSNKLRCVCLFAGFISRTVGWHESCRTHTPSLFVESKTYQPQDRVIVDIQTVTSHLLIVSCLVKQFV